MHDHLLQPGVDVGEGVIEPRTQDRRGQRARVRHGLPVRIDVQCVQPGAGVGHPGHDPQVAVHVPQAPRDRHRVFQLGQRDDGDLRLLDVGLLKHLRLGCVPHDRATAELRQSAQPRLVSIDRGDLHRGGP